VRLKRELLLELREIVWLLPLGLTPPPGRVVVVVVVVVEFVARRVKAYTLRSGIMSSKGGISVAKAESDAAEDDDDDGS